MLNSGVKAWLIRLIARRQLSWVSVTGFFFIALYGHRNAAKKISLLG